MSGQDYQRNRRIYASQLWKQFQSIAVRQQIIDQRRIRVRGSKKFLCSAAAIDFVNLVAVSEQIFAHPEPHCGFVIHQEDFVPCHAKALKSNAVNWPRVLPRVLIIGELERCTRTVETDPGV